MKKALAPLPAALAGFLLLVALLYLTVATFALRAETYPQTPPFDEMARALTDYLSERAGGLPSDLFTAQERLHMVDVLGLFQGARRIAYACFFGALPLLFLSRLLGGRRKMGAGLLIGIALFAGVSLFLGVWALIDFDGWFTAMHEMAFTNDLWLLDPAESMLIRMLPLDFFIRAVRTVAIRFGVGTACLSVLAVLCQRPRRQRPE